MTIIVTLLVLVMVLGVIIYAIYSSAGSVYNVAEIRENRQMKHNILFTILLAFTCQSWAASTIQQYKVELIVFAHVTPAALNAEQWPAKPDMPSMSRVRNLLPQSDTDIPVQNYQIMLPEQSDMNSIVATLKKAKNYPPLVHVAWLQPGLPVRNAVRIHIYGGQAYDANGQVSAAVSPLLEFQQPVDENSEPVMQTTAAGWQLNGYVRLSKPYLFQIDTRLVLTIPRAELAKLVPSVADNIKNNHFVMQQRFRMKLGELYYIDHPLFGVLVEVNKYPLTSKVKNNV